MQSIRNRFLSLASSVMLVFSLFALLPKSAFSTEALSYFPIWVCGVQVNNVNASDILGKGNKEVTYNPGTKTLELNGDLSCDSTEVIDSAMPGLTIKVNQHSVLIGRNVISPAISLRADATITGSEKLVARNNYNAGILVREATLTISDTEVNAEGKWGFKGQSSSSAPASLIIRRSSVQAYMSGNGEYAVGEFSSIALDSSWINSDRSVIKDGYIIDTETGEPDGYVYIDPFKDYGFEVAGITVTNFNFDDILGNGKKEAVYKPSTNTLELNGNIYADDDFGIFSNNKGLTIKVNKDVTVEASGLYDALNLNQAPLTITGSGKLTLKSPERRGIYAFIGDLTIVDAKVKVIGKWGIRAPARNEKLVIRNSEVTVTSSDKEINAVRGFKNGIEIEGCYIKYPYGGTVSYDETNDSYYIKERNSDTIIRDVVIALPSGIKGDADSDYNLNMQDYALLQRWLANWPVDVVKENCDMDSNGNINMQDYALLQRKLAGWNV